MQNTLGISCKSCTSELQEIRKTVRAACEKFAIDSEQSAQIVLAVDEACANVIRHSCAFAEHFNLDVEIYRQENYAVFVVSDNCPPISGKTLEPKAKDLEKPGGLGLHLIQSVMDSVRLLPCEKRGNRLEMKIKLKEK